MSGDTARFSISPNGRCRFGPKPWPATPRRAAPASLSSTTPSPTSQVPGWQSVSPALMPMREDTPSRALSERPPTRTTCTPRRMGALQKQCFSPDEAGANLGLVLSDVRALPPASARDAWSRSSSRSSPGAQSIRASSAMRCAGRGDDASVVRTSRAGKRLATAAFVDDFDNWPMLSKDTLKSRARGTHRIAQQARPDGKPHLMPGCSTAQPCRVEKAAIVASAQQAAKAVVKATEEAPFSRGLTMDEEDPRVKFPSHYIRCERQPTMQLGLEGPALPLMMSRVPHPLLLPVDAKTSTDLSTPSSPPGKPKQQVSNLNARISGLKNPFWMYLRERPRRTVREDSIQPVLGSATLVKQQSRRPSVQEVPNLASGGSAVDDEARERTDRITCLDEAFNQWNTADGQGRSEKDQTEEKRRTDAETEEMCAALKLARRFGLPVREARDLRREFLERDVNNEGGIPHESFVEYIRKRASLPDEVPIPRHLVAGLQIDLDEDGLISLEEFCQWSLRTCWTEEMLMPQPGERALRQLARDQNMNILDVEDIKKLFDEFDADGSGEIEEREFRAVIYKVMQADASDVPVHRLERYWREIDTDCNGAITFYEFLIWYTTTFMPELGSKFEHLHFASNECDVEE